MCAVFVERHVGVRARGTGTCWGVVWYEVGVKVMFERIYTPYVLLDASSHDRQQNLVAVVELLLIIPSGVRVFVVRWHHERERF